MKQLIQVGDWRLQPQGPVLESFRLEARGTEGSAGLKNARERTTIDKSVL
jgi:hypothetical protein